ncbi:MAG: LPXTG cell wall anchor domain-containing protein [Oscillospiraceae bacterium]|jgi:LPXTG-motif cell wall-anchored protein|nr:LPXTG cell wall anchor domain-containing protein [Oscillospiraceae bacterium]
MKKVLSLALAAILVLALSASAFAAPEGAFLFDDFKTARDTSGNAGVPAANGPNGMDIWWTNWVGVDATAAGDGIVHLEFLKDRIGYVGAFGGQDDADGTYSSDFQFGNWGEAVDTWAKTPNPHKYLNLNIKGAAGGEEKNLILAVYPQDTTEWAVPFTSLVLADGTSPKITTAMKTFTIDLEKSGLPQMTNRMHIYATAGCTIDLGEIYFTEPDTSVTITDGAAYTASVTAPKMGGLFNMKNTAAAPATPTNPKTGDSTALVLMVVVLLVSAGGLVTVLRLRKKA